MAKTKSTPAADIKADPLPSGGGSYINTGEDLLLVDGSGTDAPPDRAHLRPGFKPDDPSADLPANTSKDEAPAADPESIKEEV